jgi:phage terminase large subunit
LSREIVNNDQMWIADENLTRDQKKRIKDELSQIIRVPNKQDFSKLDTKSKGEIKSDLGFSPDYLDCMKMRVWFDLKKEIDLTVVYN